MSQNILTDASAKQLCVSCERLCEAVPLRTPCIVHPGAFWLPGAFLYFLVKRGTVLERASKISMKERTRISAGKTLRCGYTTGTCAAAAAGAAARMALTGTVCTQSAVCLPDGETVTFTVEEPKAGKGDASCAVRKDAGDDIDVTDKMLVDRKSVV